MPKERVHHGKRYAEIPSEDGHSVNFEEVGPDGPVVSAFPAGTKFTEDASLDVSWTRDHGHVQVAIDIPRQMWLDQLKDVENDDRITAKAIYTGSLTRQEINHIIRTLRRARDAAYGADE